MKVICIDDRIQYLNRGKPEPEHPRFGDIDIVIDEGYDNDIEEYYCLERFGPCVGYSKRHFAPLSNIDERELLTERTEKLEVTA